MKMFIKLITIVFVLSIAATTAKEITTTETTTTTPLKNWYQVDVIVFNYNDFSLDSITPRILPLEKKFSGNKIISLESSEHPLNNLKNKTVLITDESIDDKLINTEETTTVTVSNEVISLDDNQYTENITKDNTLSTSEVSVTNEFADLVKPVDATTEIVSVIDTPFIKQNTDFSNQKNINATLADIQLNGVSSMIEPSNSIENTDTNNKDTTVITTTQSSIQIQENGINQQKINELLNTTPFIELPNSRYKLTDKIDKLTTDNNVNLLGYHCFNLTIEDSSDVVLESQKIAQFKTFSGKINFKKNNQGKIIVKTDFCFNITANEAQLLHKQQNKLAEYSNKINKKLYNYFSYEAQNNIKNSGNLMYIDSPILGLLIKITPIDLEVDK